MLGLSPDIANMVTVVDLPPEIKSTVFSLIYRRADVIAALSSCKGLYNAAARKLYRHITFYERDGLTMLSQALNVDNKALVHTRHITIVPFSYCLRADLALLNHMVLTIANMLPRNILLTFT